MSRDPHSSAIDRIESLSLDRSQPSKSNICVVGGDGSASGVKDKDGTIRFGGINRKFFTDIGLDSFEGIGDLKVETNPIYWRKI